MTAFELQRATRRGFLGMAGAGFAAIVAPAASAGVRAARAVGADGGSRFYTLPGLNPPSVDVATAGPSVSPGYVFAAPTAGLLIFDNAGDPVWFHPVSQPAVNNFRVQKLAGRRVLTWWEGAVINGHGEGEYVIADSAYRVVRRLSAANGYRGDLHEFTLTSRGTALISVYNEIPADLSAYGGPADATMIEGVIQELDIASGRLVFEWHSSDHIAPDESYVPPTTGSWALKGNVWDSFHLNSIGVLDDGDLLVSARYPCAVYKLDRSTGKIVWRLGGKKSDFQLGPGATFAFQHDARGHPHGLVSIFDDGAYSSDSGPEQISRVIVLTLDTAAMTASLLDAYPNPHGRLSIAMGNGQRLSDGGSFVGWGTTPEFSEFAPDGELRFDASFADSGVVSYRAYRFAWTGTPVERPAIAVSGNTDGTMDVYASWNGATEVSYWRFLAGASSDSLHGVRTIPRNGFETSVRLAAPPGYVAAVALDSHGGELARSRTRATA